MAHGRVGPDLVMATRYVSSSGIRALSEHERNRKPDGTSAIDPERTHLNRILTGPACQQLAVDQLFASGIGRPAKQAENPFVQMVLSASPSYFRQEGQGPGEWNSEKLDDWLETTMEWLKKKFGDDVIHVALHLDEDTPHIHVLIAPTYSKQHRKPGRQKRSETEEEFEERKRAAKAGRGVRTVGRSSNEFWKKNYARRTARQSYHRAVAKLGLGYGKDFVGEGLPSPERKTTGQWVRERAAELKEAQNKLSETRTQLDAWDVELDVKERDLYDRELDLPILEFDIRKLKKELEKTEQSRAEAEEKAQRAEVKRHKAEDDLLRIADAIEVLRPAFEAAQALSALTSVNAQTRAEIFESMKPRELRLSTDEDKDQWATAIRMSDPFFAPGVARDVPRSQIPMDNFEALSDFETTNNGDFDALVGEMQREPGGRGAVAWLRIPEMGVSVLETAANTPEKDWLGRALDGVKRGVAFAAAAVSETSQALAGVFNSLPEQTQEALSRLFSVREERASPEPKPNSPFLNPAIAKGSEEEPDRNNDPDDFRP